MDSTWVDCIDRAVLRTIADKQSPGCVVLLGRGSRVVFQRAYGNLSSSSSSASGATVGSGGDLPAAREGDISARDNAPSGECEPVTIDSVYDIASLTKPLATAASILHLAERGLLLLRDPVARYFPKFTGDGRDGATIKHLLMHSAGLPAYKNYSEWELIPPAERRAAVEEDICQLPSAYPVGRGFSYSCLGYVLLAGVVEIVSGMPLDVYATQHILAPLGMSNTCFNPPATWLPRIAPTEALPNGTVLRGVVHDEVSRYLGGVGGNSGLFATAFDVSRFVGGLLDACHGRRGRPFPLSHATVAAMLAATPIPDTDVVRCLGWDVLSPLSTAPRGDLFKPGASFGHTGFTGTSVWADPASAVFCVVLTNRVHLGRDRDIQRLRSQLANISAAWLSTEDGAAGVAGNKIRKGVSGASQDELDQQQPPPSPAAAAGSSLNGKSLGYGAGTS